MKHILVSIFAVLFVFSVNADNGDNYVNHKTDKNLYTNSFDPGHKQKRNGNLGKDRAPFEIYFGSQPSWAIKVNLFGGIKHGTQVERFYFMGGMDFDQDLNAKIGISLNPGKYNKLRVDRPSIFHSLGIKKAYRYVMLRKSLEIGFKTYFMDPEDSITEKLNHRNYSGVTLNLSYAWDAIPLLSDFMWNFFDMRTARRLRLKVDAGIFLNLNKFDQPHLGAFSGANNDTGEQDINEDIVLDELGSFAKMPVYPVVSPFFNISVGFAINPHR